MSSASALYGTPHLASYSASKFAVRGLTEALNIEWANHDIRVSDIMPPFVNTNMVKSQQYQAPVLKRLGVTLDAEDVAKAVWRSVGSDSVHHPVGKKFKAAMLTNKLLPTQASRKLMALLSR
jgi:short-subunit dehydrogenase